MEGIELRALEPRERPELLDARQLGVDLGARGIRRDGEALLFDVVARGELLGVDPRELHGQLRDQALP